MNNRTDFYNSYSYFKKIKNSIKIEDILRKLEKDYNLKSNGYFELICNYHDDKNPSLTINNNKNEKSFGLFQCWSCGAKGNILDYISDNLNVEIEKSFKMLEKNSIELNIYEKTLENISKKKKINSDKKISFPRNIYNIEFNSDFHKYLKRRKISDDIINKFDLSCCLDGYFEDRIIIPISYKFNKVGFAARTIKNENELKKLKDPFNKKILYPSGFKSTNYLYPDIYNFSNKEEPIILVEGVFDVLRLYSLGYKNIFTTFSNKISKKQKYYLSFFKEIILIPDSDLGGETFKENFKELRIQNKLFIFDLPENHDPNSVHSKYLKNIYKDCYELYRRKKIYINKY